MPSSIVPQNLLKDRLRKNQTAVGTMVVEFRQPSLMQILANAGFHFVIIDTEHGPFSIEAIAELSRAAVAAGVTPIVRVPEITYTAITQPLDAGAQGIMIPRVTDPSQVREACSIMKYTPEGRRGSVLARAHTRFQSGSVVEAMAAMNRETMLVVQVETREAVDRLDELLSVDGVNAALIGPNDLSIALGCPGDATADAMVAAIRRTIQVCRKRGITPAIHINDLGQASRWAAEGMTMVSFNSEVGLMMQSGRDAISALTASIGERK